MMNRDSVPLLSKFTRTLSRLPIRAILVAMWFAYRKIWLGVFAFSTFLAVMTVLSLNNNGYSNTTADWGDAEWIGSQSTDSGPVSYYRYHFVLQNVPDSSFLKVSATDSYTVYINGKRILEEKAPSTRPVALGMPTDALRSGDNIISIRVEKKTFTGAPELLLSLSLNETYTGTSYHYSSEKWKVSSVPSNPFSNKYRWFEDLFNDTSWGYASIAASDILPAMPDNLPPEIASDKSLLDFTPIWHAFPEINQARLKTSLPYKRDQMKNAWLMVKCNGEYRLAVNSVGVGNYYSENSTIRLINIFQYLTSSHINYIDMTSECGFGEGISLKVFIALNDGKVVSVPSEQWTISPYGGMTQNAKETLDDPYIVVGQTSPELDRMRKLTGGMATLDVIDENNEVIFILKLVRWFIFWTVLFSAVNALLLFKLQVDLTFTHEINSVFVLLSVIGYLCMYWLLDERIYTDRFFNLLNTTGFALLCIMLELVLAYSRGYFQHLFDDIDDSQENSDAG